MTLRHLFTWILVALLFVGVVAILQSTVGLTAAILIVVGIIILALKLR